MPQSIIGISIGTRTIGIAIERGGHLIDWQLKSFKGKMNDQKLHMISGALLKLIRDNNAIEIVMKMPDKASTYATLNLLNKHLLKVFKRRNIIIHYYSLSDIKARLKEPIRNKKKLVEWGASKFRELQILQKREDTNRNPYYIKIFEAVSVIAIHTHK